MAESSGWRRTAPGIDSSVVAGPPVVRRRRSPFRLGAILAIPLLLAGCIGNFVNMYPTANTPWDCLSGTMELGHYCRTDNKYVTWHAQSSISYDTGIRSTLYGSYDTTDLTVQHHPQPTYSGSGETDIIYQAGSVVSGYLGAAWCNSAVSGGVRCDQHYVRFASSQPRKHVACHETGHAVGLTHGTQASPRQLDDNGLIRCMRTPQGALTGDEGLGDHNAFMIDEAY